MGGCLMSRLPGTLPGALCADHSGSHWAARFWRCLIINDLNAATCNYLLAIGKMGGTLFVGIIGNGSFAL
jgi:hypothetical protein